MTQSLRSRRAYAVAAILWSLCAAPAVRAEQTAADCIAAKLRAAADASARKLKCYAIATKRGIAVDPACLTKAESKLVIDFVRIDAHGGCSPSGDSSSYAGSGSDFVAGVNGSNLCADKLTAAAREVQALLKCKAKAISKGVDTDANCIAKAQSKFTAAFDLADYRGCTPRGGGAVVQALIDAYVASPSVVPASRTYDVTPEVTTDPAAYVPTVDRFTILNLTVQTDHGGPLTIGHPVELHAEVDVQAEPFQSTLWYGLQDENGQYCVIDHVTIEHLPAMFDAAARANLALSAQEQAAVQPSLSDCADTRTCAVEGEECLAFQEQVLNIEDPAPAGASDPNYNLPQVDEGDPPPSTSSTTTVTTYKCATTTYAAGQVVRAKSAPVLLTPADIGGNVEQRHLVGSVDELPKACEILIGSSTITAWVSFDPEQDTNFVARPSYEWPATETPQTLDETQEEHLQGLTAFLQRLPETVPVDSVQPDPGLDVDLRHIIVGSSVSLIDQDDHPGGDLHVDVEYSLDGAATAEQQAGLANANIQFHFTMQPIGAARQGCTPPMPMPDLDAVPLMIVHTNSDQTGSDVNEEPVTNVTLGSGIDKSFPLYVPPDVRAKVYGDWACWDEFQINGCLTTSLSQASAAQMGTADDCAATSVMVLRDQPPEGAILEPEPSLQRAALIQRLGNPGCSDQLFKDYAENMRKYYELSNAVFVSDYYTYDAMTWIWGTLTPPKSGAGWSYISDAQRQQGYFWHIKNFITDCEKLGGNGCWNTWGWVKSPYNIDPYRYQNIVAAYFWNPYNTSLGWYAGFKRNPQQATRDGFNFECAGIANGAVCSTINYDLNRVPELANRVRDVLVNRKRSDSLASIISPNGVGRCLDRAYPALQRTSIDDQGRLTVVPDDNVFYTDYLAKMCEKGKYKANADAIWNQIATSCTYVAKPFADSGAGIYAGRFVPELYKSYDTGFKAGLKGVAEGGVVNDYLVATALGQFKLIFGAQGRIYLESDPNNDIVGGWLNIYDIFKAWLLGNFYSDILSSNVEAGFHVMTNDIWKISFKLPTGEYSLPDPPELSKEVEKCKYLWKPPMPFRIELCGAVGGKADLTVDARVLKTGIAGADPAKADWPGIAGRVTPGVAITNKGRAGIDVFIASAGIVIVIDPTVGVYIPVEIGAKWNLSMPSLRRLDFTLAPYIKTTLELRALGGSVNGYTRWKIPSSDESVYPIPGAQWDPLDIGNLLGQEWVLAKHSWDVSGSKNF